jgi:hypothetical protein
MTKKTSQKKAMTTDSLSAMAPARDRQDSVNKRDFAVLLGNAENLLEKSGQALTEKAAN